MRLWNEQHRNRGSLLLAVSCVLVHTPIRVTPIRVKIKQATPSTHFRDAPTTAVVMRVSLLYAFGGLHPLVIVIDTTWVESLTKSIVLICTVSKVS